MKILFIGDIVGRPGRDIVFAYLKSLKETHQIDFTIANGENSAHGKGITKRIYQQFLERGIDCITMGNHTFSKSDIIEDLDVMDHLVVPHNHIKGLGTSHRIYEVKGLKLCVANILGEALMTEVSCSPFEAMEEILEETRNQADLYLVDLHAEATSEKILFAQYYKEQLAAVLGTHTHVQTADERLMGRLAYIGDVGMCGAYDSVIGRDIEEMIHNCIYHEKTRFTVAEGPAQLSAVVITIDEKEKRATAIERIQIRPQ